MKAWLYPSERRTVLLSTALHIYSFYYSVTIICALILHWCWEMQEIGRGGNKDAELGRYKTAVFSYPLSWKISFEDKEHAYLCVQTPVI